MRNLTVRELYELGSIATARSGATSAFEKFKADGFLKDAADGWIDLTPKGQTVLEAGGYQYDPKIGWKRQPEDYWYNHRHELRSGMVFRTNDGVVKLDRNVPGDATQWYVATWDAGWAYYDSTVEPGELIGMPIEDSLSVIDSVIKDVN